MDVQSGRWNPTGLRVLRQRPGLLRGFDLDLRSRSNRQRQPWNHIAVRIVVRVIVVRIVVRIACRNAYGGKRAINRRPWWRAAVLICRQRVREIDQPCKLVLKSTRLKVEQPIPYLMYKSSLFTKISIVFQQKGLQRCAPRRMWLI